MSDYKQRVRTIKYGGVKYVNNVPTEQINKFVDKLPEDKRMSMAQVTKILENEGMISLIHNDDFSPPCPE